MTIRAALLYLIAAGPCVLACAEAQSEPERGAAEPRAVAAAGTGTGTGTSTGTGTVARPSLGDPAATGTIAAVHLVSRVGADGVADDRPKRALAADGVTLFAVVEVKIGKRRHYFSDAGAIRLRGKQVATRPLAEAPAFTVAWQRVEPTTADMSNEASGSFRFEPIDYATTELAEGVGSLPADVRPTLTPDHGDGVSPGIGTMRYRLVVTQDGRELATAGTEARRGRGSGGLTDAVHRVSLRRDDTYLGILTEMYGQPYIWASAGTTARTHQSERLEGSDCADFVVYGARRMGKDIPYVWSGGLGPYTKLLGKGEVGDDGVYRDRDGEPLAFPRPGDLIVFPRHVGALVEDRGTIGVLDVEDVLMHTLFDSPKEQPLRDSGYAERPVELRRWK